MSRGTPISIVILSMALGLAGGGPALGQGYDEQCLAAVKALCGDGSIRECFNTDSAWQRIPPTCEGDVQSMIEGEREALAADVPRATELPAVSYGGILRSGPGMDYKKLASLRARDPLEVLEETDVWMGDYKWFKVKTSAGTGYHWGGIFCSMGGKPEGVFSDCADYPPDAP